MSHNIIAIPALHDNYIWMIVHPASRQAIIVDPGEAQPVLAILASQRLALAAMLITHHHWDHTGGIAAIRAQHDQAAIYAPSAEQVAGSDHQVTEGDEIAIPSMQLTFSVIDTPGHTRGHIAYYGHEWCFTGDTLFTAGCGRIFEGTAHQLYDSIRKLAKLDPATRIYCGHEYTAVNLRFAAQVEPNNLQLQDRISATADKRQRGMPTVPATLAWELQTNPFLRCNVPAVKRAAETYCSESLANNVAVFAALRRWKDEFQ